jgi:hypothetical protein
MSGPRRIIAATALCASLFAGCAKSEQGVVQGAANEAVISLSEGPCPHNTCPVYDMTLHPAGAYALNSVRYVKTTGLSEGDLGPDAFPAAEHVLEEAGFWTMQPVQTPQTLQTCHPDGPTVQVLWRTAAGKEKTLVFNGGCDVQETRDMIARLRDALHFTDLVWTSERFEFDTEAGR